MKTQNYKNHARFAPGFHFLGIPIVLTSLIIAIVLWSKNEFSLESLFYLLIALGLLICFGLTRHFANQNQDRIIRMEENSRSLKILGTELDPVLTRGQIIALRFADDSEYAELTQHTIRENLSPKRIKLSIKKWKADYHRI